MLAGALPVVIVKFMENGWTKSGSYWFHQVNSVTHKEDGPAITHHNGSRYWLINGIYHRLDGPAKSYYHNIRDQWIEEWWIDGTQIFCKDNEEFLRIVRCRVFL